jgi:hypothetical protein
MVFGIHGQLLCGELVFSGQSLVEPDSVARLAPGQQPFGMGIAPLFSRPSVRFRSGRLFLGMPLRLFQPLLFPFLALCL